MAQAAAAAPALPVNEIQLFDSGHSCVLPTFAEVVVESRNPNDARIAVSMDLPGQFTDTAVTVAGVPAVPTVSCRLLQEGDDGASVVCDCVQTAADGGGAAAGSIVTVMLGQALSARRRRLEVAWRVPVAPLDGEKAALVLPCVPRCRTASAVRLDIRWSLPLQVMVLAARTQRPILAPRALPGGTDDDAVCLKGDCTEPLIVILDLTRALRGEGGGQCDKGLFDPAPAAQLPGPWLPRSIVYLLSALVAMLLSLGATHIAMPYLATISGGVGDGGEL